MKIVIADNTETVIGLHRCYPGKLILDLRARRDGYAKMLDCEPAYFWVQSSIDKIVAQRLLDIVEKRETIYVIGSEERWTEIQTEKTGEEL